MAASELVPAALISGGRRKRIDAARTMSQGAVGRTRDHRLAGGVAVGAGGAFTRSDVPKKTARAGRLGRLFALRRVHGAGQDVYHSTRDMEGSPNSPVAHPSARVRNREWRGCPRPSRAEG